MNNPKAQGQMGAGNLIVNGVLAYFFYTYAFSNPDAGTCWAKAGDTVGYAATKPGYSDVG